MRPAARRRRSLPSSLANARRLFAGARSPGGIDARSMARRLIFFRLAADQDQFLTIAKFRALRKLWARIEKACGLDPRPAFVAAETAWRMMTKRDPHGTSCATTIAALAAAVGGADAVTVLPFSAALGTARCVRPPHRPQHADHSHRGSESPSRRRSRRRLRRHRGAHRCALPDGLVVVPGASSGWRRRRCSRKPD